MMRAMDGTVFLAKFSDGATGILAVQGDVLQAPPGVELLPQ